MFPLQKHQSTTPSVESIASEKPVLSVESASLIDYAENLRERFGLSIFRQQLDTGLETQQLDNSEREAMMDRIKSTINDYDNKHPHTGPTHIYLLDGRGLGNADDGVVNALISSSLRNPSHTLAALIPENTSYASPDDLSPSSMLKQLANRVLASEGVRCVVGKRALEAFLDGDEQYVIVGKGTAAEAQQTHVELTGSFESLVSAAILGAIIGGAGAYGVWKAGREKNKVDKDVKEPAHSASTDKTFHDSVLGTVHWDGTILRKGGVASLPDDREVTLDLFFMTSTSGNHEITEGHRTAYSSFKNNEESIYVDGYRHLLEYVKRTFPGKLQSGEDNYHQVVPTSIVFMWSGEFIALFNAKFADDLLAICVGKNGSMRVGKMGDFLKPA